MSRTVTGGGGHEASYVGALCRSLASCGCTVLGLSQSSGSGFDCAANVTDQEASETKSRVIFKYWVPALITAVFGGIVVGGVVPYATSYFESGKRLEDRRVRAFEGVAEFFPAMVAHTGKIRALEG